MIEIILLISTAIATVFATLAAWLSLKVSNNSLQFQKSYARNQSLICELNRVIYQAETLLILISKPLEMSESEYESLNPLLNKLKSSLESLNIRSIVDYDSLKISSANNHLDLARDHSCLSEVINKLEKIKNGIFE